MAGFIAGTINLTGIMGFIFYFIYFILIGVLILLFSTNKENHFLTSTTCVFNGLMGNIMVYLIFWVMFYNFVHIY